MILNLPGPRSGQDRLPMLALHREASFRRLFEFGRQPWGGEIRDADVSLGSTRCVDDVGQRSFKIAVAATPGAGDRRRAK